MSGQSTNGNGPALTKDMSPYETALAMADYGWYVFPVDHPANKLCRGIGKNHDAVKCKDRGKHNTVKYTEKATTQPQVIHAAWAGSTYNVGVNVGMSGLLVIDEDQPNGFAKYAADHGVEIPATFTVKTAKGRHYYFLDTQNGALGNEEGALREYRINVRSGNAYAVGPGSVHASGVVYTVESNIAPVPVPTWTVDAINTKTNGHKKPGTDGQPPFADTAGSYDRFVLPKVIKYGERDTALFQYASSLLARSVSRDEAEALLERAWQRCEQPPGDEYALEQALEKLDRYEPGRSEGYEKRNKDVHDSTGRQLRVTKATDIQIKATRWLWEEDHAHWIAMGSLVGLAGREGVGKSTWCAHLIAKVTRGELPGDLYGTPKGAIICTTEDDWNATLKPRLIAAGADMDRALRVDSVDADGLEGIVTLPNDLAGMEKTILEHDVALVILDPLLTFVNAKLDTHKDAEVRRALEPVVRMAHDTKASVIGLIHVNKTSDGDLMNRVMGSRAIGAVARGVLFCGSYKPVEDMAEKDGDLPVFATPEIKRARFIFGQIKNNLQAKVMKSIEYRIEGQTVGHDAEADKDIEGSFLVADRELPENVEDIILEQEKRTKGTKTGASRAEVWLAAYLTGKGQVPSGQVFRDAEGANLSRNQVYAGKAKLGDRLVVRRVAQMQGGTTWEFIPEDQTIGTNGDDWDDSYVLASQTSGLSRKTRRMGPDEWTESDSPAD